MLHFPMQCAVCSSNNNKIIYKKKLSKNPGKNNSDFTPTGSDFGIFYDLVQCVNCGVVFSIIDAKDYAFSEEYSDVMDLNYTKQEERKNTFLRVWKDITKHVIKKGRLLDIGCSYGFLLKIAQENGFEVTGLELNKEAVNYCQTNLQLPVSCKTLEDSSFKDNSIDIITALEVIEHLHEPYKFVKEVFRILKNGGIFYVSTPDINSFSSRILGRNWWSFRRMHVYYYSRKTLCSFLKNMGFKILETFPYKKTFVLDYIIHQAGHLMMKDKFEKNKFINNLIKITSPLSNIKFTTSFGDIAVIAQKP